MFGTIMLDKEQEDALIAFVEASRRLPGDKREPFLVIGPVTGTYNTRVMHKGFHGGHTQFFNPHDIELLAGYGLVHISREGRVATFSVRPEGFRYYEDLMRARGQAFEVVESEPQRFLNSDSFQRRHPASFALWSDAQKLLWGAESEENLTTIGLRCREALREYAEELVKTFPISECPPKDSHTLRLRQVVASRRSVLGGKPTNFLDALVQLWSTVGDLAERQTHGVTKEGNELMWDDARRVVFQTAIVMYEVEQALSTAR